MADVCFVFFVSRHQALDKEISKTTDQQEGQKEGRIWGEMEPSDKSMGQKEGYKKEVNKERYKRMMEGDKSEERKGWQDKL